MPPTAAPATAGDVTSTAVSQSLPSAAGTADASSLSGAPVVSAQTSESGDANSGIAAAQIPPSLRPLLPSLTYPSKSPTEDSARDATAAEAPVVVAEGKGAEVSATVNSAPAALVPVSPPSPSRVPVIVPAVGLFVASATTSATLAPAASPSFVAPPLTSANETAGSLSQPSALPSVQPPPVVSSTAVVVESFTPLPATAVPGPSAEASGATGSAADAVMSTTLPLIPTTAPVAEDVTVRPPTRSPVATRKAVTRRSTRASTAAGAVVASLPPPL